MRKRKKRIELYVMFSFGWHLSAAGLILLVLTDRTAVADSWLMPRPQTYQSENGKYVFRTAPTFEENPSQKGTCRGALYARNGAAEQRVWERPLINNIAPTAVFVSNSGDRVVTLGEYHDFDNLPVAFYGHRGELVNVYGKLDEIALKRDLPSSMSGCDWISDSLFFFHGTNDEYFVLRLINKEIVVFWTSSGRLVDDPALEREVRMLVRDDTNSAAAKDIDTVLKEHRAQTERLRSDLKAAILSKAISLAAWGNRSGEAVLDQYKGDKTAVAVLRGALKDNQSRVSDDGKIRHFPIRRAAKRALEAMGEKVPPDVVTEETIGNQPERPVGKGGQKNG